MLQTRVEALLQPYQLSVKSSEISLLNFVPFTLFFFLLRIIKFLVTLPQMAS